MVGYVYDKPEETEWEWGAHTFLFINVLFSLRGAVRKTGSYTLLFDDSLDRVNIFQLGFYISAFSVLDKLQTRTIWCYFTNRRNSGKMSIITV